MLSQLDKNADLTFPNLMKDHPLSCHLIQGYDANNSDLRPITRGSYEAVLEISNTFPKIRDEVFNKLIIFLLKNNED